jgi:hypothetical protein
MCPLVLTEPWHAVELACHGCACRQWIGMQSCYLDCKSAADDVPGECGTNLLNPSVPRCINNNPAGVTEHFRNCADVIINPGATNGVVSTLPPAPLLQPSPTIAQLPTANITTTPAPASPSTSPAPQLTPSPPAPFPSPPPTVAATTPQAQSSVCSSSGCIQCSNAASNSPYKVSAFEQVPNRGLTLVHVGSYVVAMECDIQGELLAPAHLHSTLSSHAPVGHGEWCLVSSNELSHKANICAQADQSTQQCCTMSLKVETCNTTLITNHLQLLGNRAESSAPL